MTIKVKYFASLREKAEKSEEEIFSGYTTAYDLYLELYEKYKFPLKVEDIKVAINGEYKDFNSVLNSGDTIAFIPPVAGG